MFKSKYLYLFAEKNEIIFRYDARGALGSRELVAAEGCNKSSGWDRLTPEEQRAERLCDEERYRALYCDEDEEEMYRGNMIFLFYLLVWYLFSKVVLYSTLSLLLEEELKRIHMSNSGRYGQVEFNYDDQSESLQNESKDKEEVLKAEDEEPFIPSPNLVIPEGMVLVIFIFISIFVEMVFFAFMKCNMAYYPSGFSPKLRN